ncbi:hypothetical protein [Shewanella sp.]|uniref:hypothetical protein n=1 Tax=Shewanella sp. TaxID=50422 RepID=UPI003A9708E1
MKPIKDEALQSWMYRCLLVNGITDFSAVINNNGRWRKVPFFYKEYIPFFTFPSDKDILNLFLNSSIQFLGSIPPEPWNYVTAIKKYLYNYKGNENNGSIIIKYCSSCIKESIVKNGFGYIKTDWLYDNHCKKHSKELDVIDKNSKKNVLTMLRSAFLGMEIKQGSIGLKRTFSKDVKTYTNMNNFMPCFLMDFYWIASDHRNDYFPEYEHVVFFNYNGIRKNIVQLCGMDNLDFLHFVRRKLIEYERLFPDLLKLFIERRAEIVTYVYGINDPDSFSSNLITKKGRNCSKCVKWSKEGICPISPMIGISEVKAEKHQPASTSNICERFMMYRF